MIQFILIAENLYRQLVCQNQYQHFEHNVLSPLALLAEAVADWQIK